MPGRASLPAPGAGPVGFTGSVRTARTVVALVTGEVLGKVATLVFTVVVARTLGPSDFGSLSYGLAFGVLLATFLTWGYDADLVRRGTADREQLGAALAEALVLRGVHAVPVLALGVVVALLARPGPAAAVSLLLVLIAALLDTVGDAGRAAATALERTSRTVVALVLQRVLACGLAVAVLSVGGRLVAVSAAYLASSVVGQLVLWFVLRRLGVTAQWADVDRAALRGMWRRSFLLGVDTVLSMALFRVDALMLGALSNDAAVAVYSVAYRLMETVLFASWAVSRSVFPAMVRAHRGPALLRVGEGALSVLGALFVPYAVLLGLDGAGLVRLLFGAAYAGPSVRTLELLAAAPLAFGVGFIGSYLLLVGQRSSRVLAATSVGLLLNVAMNLVLIPAYGAPGAGAATTVSYLAQAVVTVALVVPGNGVLRVDRALRVPVLAAVPMSVVLLVVDLPVLVEAVLGAAAYCATYLAVAQRYDPTQLGLLRSLVRRS